MVQAIRMPMMGNTMETGLLAEWVVEEGENVQEDDVIAVVESEKASADVVANQDGVLVRVDVEEGEEVSPGTLVGVILAPNEDLEEVPAPRSRIESGGNDGEESEEGNGEGPPESATTDETSQREAVESAEAPSERVRAAPGARKLAAEHDIDLGIINGTGSEGAVLRADIEKHLEREEAEAEEPLGMEISEDSRHFARPSTRRLAREIGVSFDEITGTGIGNRITESDVRAAAGEREKSGSTPRPNAAGDDVSGPPASDAAAASVSIDEERPLSGMRRTIAKRMSQSARQAPHVTLDREVVVERAFETADELAAAREAPIGLTDVLVAAAVRALEAHPEFNAWFEEDQLRLVSETNVAIAVDTDAGLVTPVIREAGSLSLERIAGERRRLTDAALEGDYSMDDLQGGTFTVTNLGMFNVDSFNPIINPPQVAILGVGRVRDEGDSRTCTLSLSFDHRAVDGADAARFLDTLADGIESPTAIVADRSVAGASERNVSSTGKQGEKCDIQKASDSLADAVGRDLSERAREVAAVHDWPVPTFEVEFDGGRPSITVGAPDSASSATMKRLTYAACRESVYVETIADLRDADVTVA